MTRNVPSAYVTSYSYTKMQESFRSPYSGSCYYSCECLSLYLYLQITRIFVGPKCVMCTVQVGRASTDISTLISQLATGTREDLQAFQQEGRASLSLFAPPPPKKLRTRLKATYTPHVRVGGVACTAWQQ